MNHHNDTGRETSSPSSEKDLMSDEPTGVVYEIDGKIYYSRQEMPANVRQELEETEAMVRQAK